MDYVQLSIGLVDEKEKFDDQRSGTEVSGKEIHAQMTKNQVWRKGANGEKYAVLQFNGQEFQFCPGKLTRVPKNVGEGLIRSSHILVGKLSEALTNPEVPFLHVYDEFVLGQEAAKPERSPTACEMCGEECKTLPRKTRHYDKHKGEPAYAALFGKKEVAEEAENELETTEA